MGNVSPGIGGAGHAGTPNVDMVCPAGKGRAQDGGVMSWASWPNAATSSR